jgi:hypothetical protein
MSAPRPNPVGAVPTRKRYVVGSSVEVVRAKTLKGGRERLIWVEKLGPQQYGKTVAKSATELR